jgi:hypothetical protein
MNAREFVACWRREKESLFDLFTVSSGKTMVGQKIQSLNLSDKQQVIMKEIVDGILTDTFYTLLLGLDGEASIGGVQQTYKILDEMGNEISECGGIEAEAYDQFHGENQ